MIPSPKSPAERFREAKARIKALARVHDKEALAKAVCELYRAAGDMRRGDSASTESWSVPGAAVHHVWDYFNDWSGDPQVPGGTQTWRYRQCRQCGEEEHEPFNDVSTCRGWDHDPLP